MDSKCFHMLFSLQLHSWWKRGRYLDPRLHVFELGATQGIKGMYGLHPLKGKCGINGQEHSSQED